MTAPFPLGICVECGKDLPPYSGKGRPRTYCSDECRYCWRLAVQNRGHRERYQELRAAGATPNEAFWGRNPGTYPAMMKALKAGVKMPFL